MRFLYSPHDTLTTALLRFALELVALFAIGAALGVINFLVSVAALALFNAKGDKRFQGILVSGPMRLTIEVVIAMLGIYCAYLIAGLQWMGMFAIVWVVYLYLARARLLWLAKGAK